MMHLGAWIYAVAAIGVACSSAPSPKPIAAVDPVPVAVPPQQPAAEVEVAPNSITVSVAPDPAYVERTDGAQLVNCDLLVRNASAAAFTLSEIEVSVFDSGGALVYRKFISGNGVSPAINTVPDRELAAGAQRLILNPLHTFPPDLQLAKLRFTVSYDRTGSKQRLSATTELVPRDFVGKARLSLPLSGRQIAWSGHDFLSHHRRWDYTDPRLVQFGFVSNAGRYSYDFIAVDDKGDMRNGPPETNASWFGFGRPVLAPAAGKVVAVASEEPDDRQFDMGALKQNQLVAFGNYVVIEHAPHEHSLLGHLKQHSVKVKLGDVVKPGQEIAAVGASGSSLMPHLHYQLQTSATGHAEGLPSYFHQFIKVRGTRRLVARGHIETGEIVESRVRRPR